MKICLNCFKGYPDIFSICPSCGSVSTDKVPEDWLLRPGRKIKDRYVIGDCMGAGGSSAVYAAYDTLRNRHVSVKELFIRRMLVRDKDGCAVLKKETDPEEYEFRRKRFLIEARNGASFSGERYFPEVFDCFEENGTVYLVTELIEGMTLEKYIYTYGKTADRGVFLGIAGKLLAAADRMREKGIVHRDISPDNIILCTGGENVPPDAGTGLMLIDFGSSAVNGTRISAAGTVKKNGFSCGGTGDTVTSFEDVYSCAAVLYSLLTGKTFNNSGKPEEKCGDLTDDFRAAVTEVLLSGCGKNRITPREFASRLGISLPECSAKKSLRVSEAPSQPCGALPAGTLLGRRYSVYPEARRSHDCMIYHGFDTVLLQDVEITEFYPEYLCSRGKNGSEVTTPSEKQGLFGWQLDRFRKKAAGYAAMPGAVILPDVKDMFPDNGTDYIVCGYRKPSDGAERDKKTVSREIAEICRTLKKMHDSGYAHADMPQICREKKPSAAFLPGLPREILSSEEKTYAEGQADDVYSAASLTYYSICGFFPPDVKERLEYIGAGRDDPFYMPGKIRRKLGKRSEVLKRAFSLNPDDRCKVDEILEIAEELECPG